MKNRIIIFVAFILAYSLVLSACNASSMVTPTNTPDIQALVETGIAQTLDAATSSPTATVPSNTPTVTATLFPINTPTYDWRPTKAPCNAMEWIADVTIPDNTHLVPGTQFVKTWRIMNSGSCNWNTSWQLVFISGDQMGALNYVPIPRVVASGTMVDLSVMMTAPADLGLHTGNWMVMDPSGVRFGSGDGTAPITVQIITDPYAFAITNVIISVDSASNTSTCPPGHTFQFTAAVTATGPGTAQLQWKWSDGTLGSTDSLTFTAPGTKYSTGSWTVTSSLTGSASVYVDFPNHQTFGPGGTFTMTCTSP